LEFALPPEEFSPAWRLVIDTSGISPGSDTFPAGGRTAVAAKGTVVLMGASTEPPAEPDTLPAAVVPVAAPPVVPGAPSPAPSGPGSRPTGQS
jgi:glycogen operon protein